jgi:hypothetical protein
MKARIQEKATRHTTERSGNTNLSVHTLRVQLQ